MLQHEHFSHGLLYSLSPEHIAQMHLGDVTNKNMNNPSELQAAGVRKSFTEHLVAFLKKTLKKPA
jgi:hypothetical protein